MTQDQAAVVYSPTNEPPHEFTDMPLKSVTEVVKSLSELEFDESKMDCNYLSIMIFWKMTQTICNKILIKFKMLITVEINQLSGLEMVQYTNLWTF